MSGTMIEFKGNGENYSGYLSPSAKGQGPGVIVIQEYWGLVGHIKSVADRFAAAGYTALAPDFYHGKTTKEPDEAGSLMMQLQIPEATKVINGAIEALLANPATTGEKVAVVGFCMGGQLSFFAATINPNIGACVSYYGIHPGIRPKVKELKAPFMGFFAEFDEFVTPTMVSTLHLDLSEAGKTFRIHEYPGRRHAFFNDERPEVYDKEAADDSWAKMISFFHNTIG
jgi:carboxymethylenebutenolidase